MTTTKKTTKTSEAAMVAAFGAVAQHWGTKSDRARRVAEESGCSRAEGLRAVEAVLAWVAGCLDEDLRDLVATLPFGAVVAYDTRAGRARARTLPTAEEIAAEALNQALSSGVPGSVEFESFDGGRVANSYGYPADADSCRLLRVEGRLLVRLERGRARSSPFGKGASPDYRMSNADAAECLRLGRRLRVTPTSVAIVPCLAVAADAHQEGA